MHNFWGWGAQLRTGFACLRWLWTVKLWSFIKSFSGVVGWHYKVCLASTSVFLKLALNWSDKGESSFDFESDRERKNLHSKDIEHLRKNNQIYGIYYLENKKLIANLLKHSSFPFNILFWHICITSHPSYWEVWIQTNWCSGWLTYQIP